MNLLVKIYQLAIDTVWIDCTLAFPHFVICYNAEIMKIFNNSRSDKVRSRLITVEVYADRNKLYAAEFFIKYVRYP